MREIDQLLKCVAREIRAPLQDAVQTGLIKGLQAVGVFPGASLEDCIQSEHERLQFGVHPGKTFRSISSASALAMGCWVIRQECSSCSSLPCNSSAKCRSG